MEIYIPDLGEGFDQLLEELKTGRIKTIEELCRLWGVDSELWNIVIAWTEEGLPKACISLLDERMPWMEGFPVEEFPSWQVAGFYRCVELCESRGKEGVFRRMFVYEIVTAATYASSGNTYHIPGIQLRLVEATSFGFSQCQACGAGTIQAPEPRANESSWRCSQCGSAQ